jgi:hypothetical protein
MSAGSRRRVSHRGRLALVAIACALLAAPIGAESALAEPVQFQFGFTTVDPATPAGAEIHITYPDGEGGKPRPLRTGAIEFPDGTKIDEAAVPVCTASDDELRMLGTWACPETTRLGSGEITAVTGCGPPLDPFIAEIHAFHGPRQVIYAYTPPGTPAPVLFVARDVIDGRTLRSQKPLELPPGCPPPDGRTHPKIGKLTLTPHSTGGRHFITTPRRCHRGGTWTARLIVEWADDLSTEVATTTTSCQRRS